MATRESYQTKQKKLIFDCLKEKHGQCMTVEQLYENLNATENEVGMTTIYRYLNALVAEDKIHRVTKTKGQAAMYQLKTSDCDKANHFHLQCLGCGTLIHIDCETMGQLGRHLQQEHQFKMDGRQTVIYGYCHSCS